MLVIAVIVAVSIGITKAKLDNIVSYTYYNTYSTLRKISTEMLADWDPTDPEYKQQAFSNSDHFQLANAPLQKFNLYSKNFIIFANLIQMTENKVKAAIEETLTSAVVYQCAVGNIYSAYMNSDDKVGTEKGSLVFRSSSFCEYTPTISYEVTCPGKFQNMPTYDSDSSLNSCERNCDNLKICGITTPSSERYKCNCGSRTHMYNAQCRSEFTTTSGSVYNEKGEFILNLLGTSDMKILSSSMNNEVCKYTIGCNEGYSLVRYSDGGYGCTNQSTGACNKTCISGYTLNTSTCTCEKDKYTCWDGSKVDYSFECPSKVTCWDGSFVHDKSECPACNNKPATIPCGQSWDSENCKITGSKTTCSIFAPNLNTSTCQCYADCWDGSTANYTWDCPTKYTCWDGSFVHDTSECPACTKTCSSGYELNIYSCECEKIQVTCWDGSKADTYAECPSYVTCWNGSKKYNYSQCPPCPNKPACPASNWNDITCTGDAKTCPSGQHLNSGCNCVNDCPSAAELTPCRKCDNETGIVSTNPDINRTCSDETYEWSEEQCKCIISPRTLPRKGMNFCKLFERHSNIMGNTDVCSGSVISEGTTNFADKKPDISLRNGIRLYNMHRDATALPILAGNTQGGVYDGVPNTNEWGYTVYADIDGIKGDSQLWSDVYPFYITLSGKIIPGYDSANPGVSGGDSTRHMQVSVEYEDYTSGKRRIKWLSKSVPFKEGSCKSGYIGDATPYCRNNTAISKLGECTTDGNSLCRLKFIQPVKFFF